MPLHLLGKKSWNVYNTENIARVRRDEALAASHEAAEEQRMQDEDHARRMAILRGEAPPPLTGGDEDGDDGYREEGKRRRDRREEGRDGMGVKRRKLRGEDDTERDIRVAREEREVADRARERLVSREMDGIRKGDVVLYDHDGHMNLFPVQAEAGRKEKDADVEAAKARKKKEEEGMSNMRFGDAAGYGKRIKATPWYAGGKDSEFRNGGTQPVVEGKDVWGNEDPRRKERDRSRMNTTDPLAFMRKAQKQLKQAEVDKRRWQEERERELGLTTDLGKKQRRTKDMRSYEKLIDDDKIESLDLDANSPDEHNLQKSREHLHRRHRNRSRSRSPRRREHRSHRPHRSYHDHRARSRSRENTRHRHRLHETGS